MPAILYPTSGHRTLQYTAEIALYRDGQHWPIVKRSAAPGKSSSLAPEVFSRRGSTPTVGFERSSLKPVVRLRRSAARRTRELLKSTRRLTTRVLKRLHSMNSHEHAGLQVHNCRKHDPSPFHGHLFKFLKGIIPKCRADGVHHRVGRWLYAGAIWYGLARALILGPTTTRDEIGSGTLQQYSATRSTLDSTPMRSKLDASQASAR
jgi:hypothetical protein